MISIRRESICYAHFILLISEAIIGTGALYPSWGYYDAPVCAAGKTGTAGVIVPGPTKWKDSVGNEMCDTTRSDQLQSPIELPPGTYHEESMKSQVFYEFPDPLVCDQGCKTTNTGTSLTVGPFPQNDDSKLLRLGEIFGSTDLDNRFYSLDHIDFKWGE